MSDMATWTALWPDVFIPDCDNGCARPKSGLWRQENDRSNACETFIGKSRVCKQE